MDQAWLRSLLVRGDEDHGLAVALRRRMAALVAEWDSIVSASLSTTSSRDGAEVEAGFRDDGVLCHIEPEAEAAGDEVLLRRVPCGCFRLNCSVSVEASSSTAPLMGAGHGEAATCVGVITREDATTGQGAGHGEAATCVGVITRKGVTTGQGAGHGEAATCVGAGHGEGAGHGSESTCLVVTTPADAEGGYGGASDIFLTGRRNGYGYYLDTVKNWVKTKLGLTNSAEDIPLEWSWANMMGAPIYQSDHHTLGASGDGSCVICSCMTCIHAQHRLAFERQHGARSFPHELCATLGVLKFKFLCGLGGVWNPIKGSRPPRVLEMLAACRSVGVGLELRDVPNSRLTVHSYDRFDMKDISRDEAMMLLRLDGPMIGSLHITDEYFISDFFPDYVYRGVPGADANHAVVCVGYRFVQGELHIQVLDNHTQDGPLRWVLFEAFQYFTCIRVDPLTPEELPRPRTSLLRKLFSLWK